MCILTSEAAETAEAVPPSTCTWRELHLRLECQVMAKLAKDEAVEAEAAGGFPTALASVHDWDKDHQPHPFYQCILPLRCLLIKDSRPDQWAAIEVLCYL